jgi:hypothetical protein
MFYFYQQMIIHKCIILDKNFVAAFTQLCISFLFIFQDTDTWIGGRSNNITEFRWNYNDNSWSDMNFTNWELNQPSFPEQNCVHMWKARNYKWDNDFCYKLKQFICKRNK